MVDSEKNMPVINPLPHSPDFQHLWKRKLLKTLWEEEKMLFPQCFLLFPTQIRAHGCNSGRHIPNKFLLMN